MSLKPAAFVLNERILSGTTPLQLSSSHPAPRQLRRSSRRAKKKRKKGGGGGRRLMRQKISFRVPNKKGGGFQKSALKKTTKKHISASDKRPAFQFKSVTFDKFCFCFFGLIPSPLRHPILFLHRVIKWVAGFKQWSLELARGWVEG